MEFLSEDKKMTRQQQEALHVWFTLLAQELNEAGLDLMQTLRHDVEIPWSPILVKELIWRKVQITMVDKVSTTELNTKEIDKIYEVVNRHLGEKFGLHVPFPSKEN